MCIKAGCIAPGLHAVVLNQHRTTEPTEIMQQLRLDETSLEYYQNLLRQRDLRTLKATKTD
ncbi:hypothetical protein N574_09795 [Lactiplantibacillus plantarum 2165]|nr:hypothetical protein N574_09795 [Lactiplantibacillus plantarum 2165]